MSAPGERLRILAPAKVNLFLEVMGRRENGYHDIRSVVVPVSLFDVLDVEGTDSDVETVVSSGTSVCANDPGVVTSERNLATRAALALRRATGSTAGARIRLQKNIPIGGGLGGGSADAAAVLIALNRLWRTELPRETLMALGSELGCDIPALVQGGAVCMEKLGDRIIPIPVGAKAQTGGWWVVLVNPGFSVMTGDIYSRCKTCLTSREADYRNVISSVRSGELDEAVPYLFNGLQETVFRKYPLIEMVAEGLQKAGALGVLLCGSGASVFGLTRDECHARAVEDRVRTALGCPVWAQVARTLPDGVMAAHGPLEA